MRSALALATQIMILSRTADYKHQSMASEGAWALARLRSFCALHRSVAGAPVASPLETVTSASAQRRPAATAAVTAGLVPF